MHRGWVITIAASVGAGLLMTAGLPPFGWWPLALAGAGVLAWLLPGRDWRGRAAVGAGAGLGLVGPGLFWMAEFTSPGYVLSVILETAMVAVAVAAVPAGRWRWVGFPSAVVLVEALRGHWPFEGVPIATLAQTQIGGWLMPTARIGGHLLVAAVVAVAGVALAEAARRRWLPAAGAAALVVALTAGAVVAPDGRRAGTLRVALVQGGGERGTRAINTSSADVFRAHVQATEAVPGGLDLVLWPEDVVDIEGDVRYTTEGQTLGTIASRLDTTLVAGVVQGSGRRFVNLAVAWGPDGAIVDSYEKNVRVPFGEWIPFRSLVERVADVGAVPRDARVGKGPGVLETPAGDLGTAISWEVFFARRSRAAIGGGGDVLLVPTNAASFSTTQMPAIELGVARLRAVETGRFVLQAAPTGFSAIIGPDGAIRARTDLGARAVITDDVERRTGSTLYTRTGDGPWTAGAAIVLAAAWVVSRPRRGASSGVDAGEVRPRAGG